MMHALALSAYRVCQFHRLASISEAIFVQIAPFRAEVQTFVLPLAFSISLSASHIRSAFIRQNFQMAYLTICCF